MPVTPMIILSIESKLPSCLLLINEEPSIKLTFKILSFYLILVLKFLRSVGETESSREWLENLGWFIWRFNGFRLIYG